MCGARSEEDDSAAVAKVQTPYCGRDFYGGRGILQKARGRGQVRKENDVGVIVGVGVDNSVQVCERK